MKLSFFLANPGIFYQVCVEFLHFKMRFFCSFMLCQSVIQSSYESMLKYILACLLLLLWL